MDNIMDLQRDIQQRLIHEALPELPGIPIVEEASSIFGDKIMRLLLLGQLCMEANDAIVSAGFDPVDFHIDGKSVDRFLTTDHLDDEDAMFNGVFFDWVTEQGLLIRIATSTVFEDGQPRPSLVDILRIGPDDDHWEILDEGEWDDDGPPVEFFEFLEEAWENDSLSFEEDASDEDHTIAQLNISVDTYNRLDAAGLDTLDEVAALKEKTLGMLLGEQGLAEVMDALAVYGLTPEA